ncbi:MAG: P-II family nitrogen regulator [Alphaproteobacteria bacterium]|jgi:nitrogen regulatory protein P-II 2|nr:P-II family nitrogen regulator [Alphaproteobacteria bacterium]
MKFIVAIVQPFRLDAVREGLSELGVEGLTASEVRGFGRQKGHREVYRGSEYTINYVPKVKLEIAVADEMAERVIETVQNIAQTGKIGDGKIFVFEMSEAVRVRTGETGEGAL